MVNCSGPALSRAAKRVRRMQTKLHQWATEDPVRRFDDLFNLITTPPGGVLDWVILESQWQ